MSGILQGVLASIGGAPTTYIEDVFSTYLYTGNGSSQTITNGIDLLGKGGMVWVKNRNNASGSSAYGGANGQNLVFDTNRGMDLADFSRSLATNLTNAQSQFGTGGVGANSNGFSVGYNGFNDLNQSSNNYVGWTFRKQAKFFDVVTYTGDGDADRNIAHNLGSVPGMIIIKRTSGTSNWATAVSLSSTAYGIGGGGAGSGFELSLNLADGYYDNPLKSTIATDTTVNVPRVYYNNATVCNASGATYVMYLFAHNAGGFGLTGTDNVISCGSVVGAGNPTEVNLGYEPQFLLMKNVSSAQDWWLVDNMRGFVVENAASSARLNANTSGAETVLNVRPTATGFISGSMSSGQIYIYVAIRRGPMATPTVATTVFNPVYGQSGAPGFRSSNFNAGVDTSFVFLTSGYNDGTNAYQNIQTRLTGLRQLQTGNNRVEVSQSYNTWDYMNGQNNTTFYDSTWGSWLFRRAPGFHDVVCYTGNSSSGRAITHNLGVVPELMIIRARENAVNWFVQTPSLISQAQFLWINSTDPAADNSTQGYGVLSQPTASVFYVTNNAIMNNSGWPYIAYLFATVAGVSKVGSYTGTGSTQTINAGLPTGARFVLIRRTDSTGTWWVWDTTRGMVAGTNPRLALNNYNAQINNNWVYTVTNGFQIVTTDASVNASGGSYIYLAIA